MPENLPSDIADKISKLGKEGREAWQNSHIDVAESRFLEAWHLIPEPREGWNYGQIMSKGLVVFYRDTKQFDKAIEWIETVRRAYGTGIGPETLIGFLSGSIYFEKGDLDTAFEFFDPLYEKYGSDPFKGADKKYLDFTKKRIQTQKK